MRDTTSIDHAPALALSRTFAATPAHVRDARRFLAGLLDDHQMTDGDALLCLSELVTNAVMHSHSREPGGSFTVRVQLNGQRLRVEVGDQGGHWHSPPPANAEERGRGLVIVGQLASRWGCQGHSQTGWTVWYELDLDPGQ